MEKSVMQKRIGQNLQNIREAAHLTREDVAAAAGISATYYANLECGNKMMSIETLFALCDVYGVGSDRILFGDSADARLRDIESLLKGKPEPFVLFIENFIRLCGSAHQGAEDNAKK